MYRNACTPEQARGEGVVSDDERIKRGRKIHETWKSHNHWTRRPSVSTRTEDKSLIVDYIDGVARVRMK
jgi:hypothetical protein